MTEKLVRYGEQGTEPIILTIRGQKVVLDMELARIYGVTTKVFNQAVKRNKKKFYRLHVPVDGKEYEGLRSQFAISNRSQFVTGSQRHRNRDMFHMRSLNTVAVMAANILRSTKAIQNERVCGACVYSYAADAY